MRALFNLLQNLPWWGVIAVVAGLVIAFYVFGWYVNYRFHQIAREAVLEAGSALAGAEVVVNSVTAVPVPDGASPYDISPDDEEFAEGIDDATWDDDGANYYAIDATISPALELAAWDPTGLALVPADFEPDDPIDVSEQMCPLHSAQIFENGQFQPAREAKVRGPQRVKFVFAVHDGVRAVKFASLVTYFGRVDLPAPLPKAASPIPSRKSVPKWGI